MVAQLDDHSVDSNIHLCDVVDAEDEERMVFTNLTCCVPSSYPALLLLFKVAHYPNIGSGVV